MVAISAQGNFDLLSTPRGVGEGFGDVGGFQLGIREEDVFSSVTGGHQAHERTDRHTHAADARLPAH